MYDYRLASGVLLDGDRMLGAILEGDAETRVYLDTETGAFITLGTSAIHEAWRKSVGELAMHRYLLLAPLSLEEREACAREFIDSLLTQVAPDLVPRARRVYTSAGLDGLEDLFSAVAPELAEGWYMHVDLHAGARLHELLMTFPYATFEIRPHVCDERCSEHAGVVARGAAGAAPADTLETEDIMQRVFEQIAERQRGSE